MYRKYFVSRTMRQMAVGLAVAGAAALLPATDAAFAAGKSDQAHAAKGTHGKGHGKIASAMKGTNAAHASDRARARANPASRVGLTEIYRVTYGTYLTNKATRDARRDVLQGIIDTYAADYGNVSVSEIDASIAALDPTSATYDDDLAALQAQRLLALEADAAAAEITVLDDEEIKEQAVVALALDDASAPNDSPDGDALDYLKKLLGF